MKGTTVTDSSSNTPVFDSWRDPQGSNYKLIVFVGDLHIANERNLHLLEQILAILPDQVILSNLSGSPIFERIKKLFYAVHNPARHELSIGSEAGDSLTNDKILNHISDETQITMVHHYVALQSACLQLQGHSESDARNIIADMSPTSMARQIWRIGAAEYFGRDWFLHQHPDLKAAAAAEIETNAHKFCEVLTKMISAGIKVIVMQGNFDLRSSNAHGNYGWDVPIFNSMKFYKSLGAEIITRSLIQKTPFANIVYQPYWSLTPYQADAMADFDKVTDRLADSDGVLPVLVISGCEACWEPHYPNSPTPTGSRATMIDLLGSRLAQMQPDAVLYSRQPKPFSNTDGKPLPLSTGYQLVVEGDRVQLARDKTESHIIQVNFVPVGHAAAVALPWPGTSVATNALPPISPFIF